MGRNEWESGHITLSASDFPKFRKIIVDTLNERQDFLLEKAKALHADLLATHAAEKSQSLDVRVETRLAKLRATPPEPFRSSFAFHPSPRPVLSREDSEAIEQVLVGRPSNSQQDTHLLRRPTREQFPLLPMPPKGSPDRPLVRLKNGFKNRMFVQAKVLHGELIAEPSSASVISRVRAAVFAKRKDWEDMPGAMDQLIRSMVKQKPAALQRPTAKSFPHHKSTARHFSNSEASLALDPATRQMRWTVEEGKNAVSDAWESLLGVALDKALKQMTWTRATGGTFWGGNEYDRDYDQEHGPGEGSSVSRRLGPLGFKDVPASIRKAFLDPGRRSMSRR